METKKCSRCKKELPATEEYFYTHKNIKHRFRSECKQCHKSYMLSRREKNLEYNRNYYSENREALLEQKKEHRKNNLERLKLKDKIYRENNKSKIREQKLVTTFKVPIEVIVNKLDNQKGCCEICGDSLVYPDSTKSYAVDHNHETGEVRGLLCNFCNTALGYLKEDINIVSNLLLYIEKYNAS